MSTDDVEIVHTLQDLRTVRFLTLSYEKACREGTLLVSRETIEGVVTFPAPEKRLEVNFQKSYNINVGQRVIYFKSKQISVIDSFLIYQRDFIDNEEEEQSLTNRLIHFENVTQGVSETVCFNYV